MNTTARSIFSKIIDREIPADIVFENERLIAIRDINPQASLHLLVIPKTSMYQNVTELATSEPALLAEMVATAHNLATIHASGEYRLVFNSGESVGQTVFHVHAHVLAGQLQEHTLA
ncbi:MAG: histidine triad (HIT) family protein [Alpinimonas sp.]|jgi:histidine triad (HIT) family protein